MTSASDTAVDNIGTPTRGGEHRLSIFVSHQDVKLWSFIRNILQFGTLSGVRNNLHLWHSCPDLKKAATILIRTGIATIGKNHFFKKEKFCLPLRSGFHKNNA